MACELRNQISEGPLVVCAESVTDHIAFTQLDIEFQDAFDSTKTLDWHSWPQHTDNSLAYAPSMLPAEYCLEHLRYLYGKRQAADIGAALQSGVLELEAAITSLQIAQAIQSPNGQHGQLPSIITAAALCLNPPPAPPEIIAGVLHRGSKMVLGGGSKSFKTWLLLDLAYRAAHGVPWFAYPTAGGPVLYLNFELPGFAIESRLHELAGAINLPLPDTLHLWNLRGYAADATTLLPAICAQARALNPELIVLDPLYKILGPRDENLSRDMASLMNLIERLALDTDAAIVFGAHFAKGNASLKEAIDRFSGSGVIGRDPDSIVTLTQHAEENCLRRRYDPAQLPPSSPLHRPLEASPHGYRQ